MTMVEWLAFFVLSVPLAAWLAVHLLHAARNWKFLLCYAIMPAFGVLTAHLAGIETVSTFPVVPLLGFSVGVGFGHLLDQACGWSDPDS